MTYPDPPSTAKYQCVLELRGPGRDFHCLSLSYFSLVVGKGVYNAVHSTTAYFVNDQDWPEAPHIAYAYLLLLKKSAKCLWLIIITGPEAMG